MATISNTPRPGYVWDSTDNVWYPIGVGAHQHTNAADTPAVMPYSTYAAAGKNKIINGDFAINQRGFTTTSTISVYGFDRWYTNQIDGTTSYSAQTFTPGTAPVSGYEGKNFARLTSSGQSASNAQLALRQGIEDVRTFAGQTVTVSFWAKAASGTPKVAIEFIQFFGTGGSPSTSTLNYGGQVTLSTSWERYSVNVNIPSISGKTIGTAENASQTILVLWCSAGSDVASRTGSLGIQNNTFDFWGVQVEAGSTATAFQTATGNPASELAACQRYYWRATSTGQVAVGTGATADSTNAWIVINNPTTMRVAPTAVDFATLTVSDSYSYTVDVTSVSGIQFSPVAGRVTFTVASGLTQGRVAIGQTKSSGGYIGFSAEF